MTQWTGQGITTYITQSTKNIYQKWDGSDTFPWDIVLFGKIAH